MFSRLALNLGYSCLILRTWNYTCALPFLKVRALETQRLYWLPCGISILFDRVQQGSILSGAYATYSAHRTQASSLSISAWWVLFKKLEKCHGTANTRSLLVGDSFSKCYSLVTAIISSPTPYSTANFSWTASHISLHSLIFFFFLFY